MNSQKVLYNKIGDDENYTPFYGVVPILKYVEEYWERNYTPCQKITIWCPFDKENSQFVLALKELHFVKVVYSHIDYGQDFFEYEPSQWDIIISNPPFKKKKQFFERALSFGKPFALICTNAWLNDSGSKKVFLEAGRQMQLLMFNNRMRFTNPEGRPNNKITFSSSYYCCDFLPNDLILHGDLNISKKK